MKHPFSFSLVVLVFIFFTACRKENPVTNPAASIDSANQNTQAETSNAVNRLIDPLTGYYMASGTRTLYNGNISDSSIFMITDIAAFEPRKMMWALNANTLTCDYADLGSTGSRYLIISNRRTGEMDVEPDSVLKSNMIPGSWKVLAQQFYRNKKKFYFKTFYTNPNGNDRIVEETLVHE
jgi:hypothetical protein